MVELIVICFCCVSRGDSVMWCSPVVLVLVLVLVSAAIVMWVWLADEAVVRKQRAEDRRELLQQSLLDQAIHDAGIFLF